MAMTVLFIHGFPFDHAMWRHQLAHFREHQCIAPDLRGAGSSDAPRSPAEYSMHHYAADLVELLYARGVDQAVVCGLSMGGYIAFELLRSFPERVRAAVLCNTKATPDDAATKRKRDEMAAKAQAEGAAAIAEQLLPSLLAQATRDARPQLVAEVAEMIARQPVAGIVGALRAMRERPDSTPLLEEIRVPVLVIAGEEDSITPAEGMRQMASSIPGAKFALIRGAAHLTPLEQPEAFNAALRVLL